MTETRTDTATQLLETGARASYAKLVGGAVDRWDAEPEAVREAYRDDARVMLAAVLPLLADEIEDPAETVPAFDGWTKGYAGGMSDAARLLRDLAEQVSR